jgi:hypothetical protein
MGHAAKHLKDFLELDPNLTEESVAKILTLVKETYSGVPQGERTIHTGEVIIAGKSVVVKVVVTSSGNIKTGFPVQ